MSEYEVGEIVDITIKGARVVGNKSHNGYLTVSYLVDDPDSYSDALGPGRGQIGIQEGHAVTVTRVAPAEWPPQPGDLWRDVDGDLWLTRAPSEATQEVGMVCSVGPSRTPLSARAVHTLHGPLTLVHREDEQTGGEGR